MNGEIITFQEIVTRQDFDLTENWIEVCTENIRHRGKLLELVLWPNNSVREISWTNHREWVRKSLKWKHDVPGWSHRQKFPYDCIELFIGPIEYEDGEIFFMLNEYNYVIIFPRMAIVPNLPCTSSRCVNIRKEALGLK